MKFIILALSGILSCQVYAQSIANGNFNSGTASWGCNPETNAESVYGGSSNTNVVAEVDAVAGLCQTITGLTVGALYRVTFLCSRRTSCGPTVQSMTVTISGGAASKNISRNGTAFSLVTEFVDFVPTATVHTLTFTGTTTETCNLLVDNVQLVLVSALPVELSSFTANCSGGSGLLNWTTESESRTDHFTIESSADGLSWKEEAQVKAQFSSQTRTDYSYRVDNPLSGTSYYRLLLTDVDGTEEMLSVASLTCENDEVTLYPNPAKGLLTVNASANDFAGVFDASGRSVSADVQILNKKQFQVDLSGYGAGLYFLQISDHRYKIVKE
ncbi:T9SS type A sorting domain-containing protein [Fluviicola sp.]|uniref:T9SS type A sorting domain-containing protein n=1 Tax=Fluviicola sp. TaxID=1917219 RepID=UPI0031E26998